MLSHYYLKLIPLRLKSLLHNSSSYCSYSGEVILYIHELKYCILRSVNSIYKQQAISAIHYNRISGCAILTISTSSCKSLTRRLSLMSNNSHALITINWCLRFSIIAALDKWVRGGTVGGRAVHTRGPTALPASSTPRSAQARFSVPSACLSVHETWSDFSWTKNTCFNCEIRSESSQESQCLCACVSYNAGYVMDAYGQGVIIIVFINFYFTLLDPFLL